MDIDQNIEQPEMAATDGAYDGKATPRTLVTLPPEILHHVCSFLKEREVRVLRLVCKHLAEIGASYALPRVVFYLHKGDLEALRLIADHPVYPKHVKELVYVTEVLNPELMSRATYAKKLRHKEEMRRRDLISRRHYHIHQHHHEGCYRAKEARHMKRIGRRALSPSKNEEQIKASYREYKRLHAAQAQLIGHRADFATLKEIIPKLPALQDVMISSDWGFREDRVLERNPFANLYCDAQSYLHPEGARQLLSILEALEAAGNKRIKNFRACYIHWEFFRQAAVRFDANRWGAMCENLTCFEIIVRSNSEDGMPPPLMSIGGEGDEDLLTAWSEIEMCRKVVRRGYLKTLLRHMPNLETLSIIFHFDAEPTDDGMAYPAGLSDIIPPGMKWPNLECLRLEIVETDREELMDFLLRHKDSLMRLYLKEVQLTQSSWLRLLPQMREELETQYWADILIAGPAYGQSEEENMDVDEIDGTDEMWELGDPEQEDDRECLAEKIADYFLSDVPLKCPLTKANQVQDEWPWGP